MFKSERSQSFRSFLLRLQSDFVLPTARTVYLIGACLAVLGIGIGIVVALYFQTGTWRSDPTYVEPAVKVVGPAEVDLASVQSRLAPPHGITLRVAVEIQDALTPGDLIGYFDAETANGLPIYPEDFDILGGTDAHLFDRIPVRVDGRVRSGLTVTGDGAAEVYRRATNGAGTFTIRVIARDKYGLRSQATDVSFTLAPGAAPAASAPRGQSALEVLASQIARAADPTTGGYYVDVYKAVLRMPSMCGADADEERFVASFRTTFEHVRQQINAQTVSPFLAGVCEGWRKGKQDRDDALAREEAKIIDARREHSQAVATVEGERLAARIWRNLSLTFVGGALAVFLSIALLLAFLAMEGHSKALRLAVEEMARRRDPSDGERDRLGREA